MKRSPIKSRPRRKPLKRAGETDAAAIMRDARAAALERDNYECQATAMGSVCFGGVAAHHVLPRGRGGMDHPSNLIAVCAFHHNMGGAYSIHGNPARAYELGLLQRSGDTPCAGCTHVERLHARGGQCTYGPELGHECPCTAFVEEAA